MESGTGADRTSAGFDALYEEAKTAVSYAANEVRALTERARGHLVEGDGSNGGIARLELAVRSLERLWLFLGSHGEGTAPIDLALDAHDAQEGERARIAREIHDGPAQSLANLAFQADIIHRLLDTDPADARQELRALRTALDAEVDELRTLINRLRPAALDRGLPRALRDAAAELARDHDVRVELGPQPPFIGELEQTVALRIAQEALRNVRKHAHAEHVAVATASGADGWTLEVADDGSGFDVAEAIDRTAGRHFGLRFMRERAESVGGQLTIDSGPNGTRVRLTITPSGERSSAW